MTPLKLPPWRHVKSRQIGDYTFSEHADGFDDCLSLIIDILDAAEVPYVEPGHIKPDEAAKYE